MQLLTANQRQLCEMKCWFTSQQAIFRWGGPAMTYPISDNDFLKLMQQPHLNSYCLLDDNQQLLAFGQFYIRLGQRHLGRLAVKPDLRGKGLGKELVARLLAISLEQYPQTGASLFVFTDNLPAFGCYQSLGFVETEYPEKSLPGNMQNCIYMTQRP